MSAVAAAPLLGSVKFTRDNADRASFVAVLDEAQDVRILAKSLAQIVIAAPTQTTRGVVVELRPRTFTETAAHFVSVTKAVAWSTDEHDID
jgi:hypothetical protein